MKKLFTLGLFIISATAFAQEKITINEEMVTIDGSARNSLTVILVGSNTDDATKAWKKELKNMKGKVSDKTFVFGDDCTLKEMGDNSFDVYSLVEEAAKGARLVAAFDLGGAYLSTEVHPTKYPIAEKFIYGFAVEQAKSVVALEIETNEKALKDLEKDQSGLKKDEEKEEKDVEDYKAKIEENKTAIAQNIINQANKQKEVHRLEGSQIEGQIEEVQKVIKGFKKELAGLVKDKTLLEKDNQNLLEKIKNSNSDIKKNVKNQAEKKAEIEALKEVVKNLGVKLNSIK